MDKLITVILCGGLGTRLRSVVSDRPKSMALISGRPYLEIMVKHLASIGLKELVLLTGYMAESIQNHFGDGSRFGVHIRYSHEETPLGTAGAVRMALPLLSDPFFVLNGDSYLSFDPDKMLAKIKELESPLIMAAVQVDNASRYGALDLDENLRVTTFHDKTAAPEPGWINAGVYLLRQSLLASLPAGESISIERDIFSKLPAGSIVTVPSPGPFIDIGIPEDLERAQSFPFPGNDF